MFFIYKMLFSYTLDRFTDISFLVFSWAPGCAIAHGLRMVWGADFAPGERWSFLQPAGGEARGNTKLLFFICFFLYCLICSVKFLWLICFRAAAAHGCAKTNMQLRIVFFTHLTDGSAFSTSPKLHFLENSTICVGKSGCLPHSLHRTI